MFPTLHKLKTRPDIAWAAGFVGIGADLAGHPFTTDRDRRRN